MPSHHNNFLSRLAVLSVSIVLSGCAAQMAYRDGQQLVSHGQPEEGLQKLHEAVVLEPQNIEYKATYVQTHERLIAGLLEQADRLLAAGQRAAAEQGYRAVQGRDTNNARAHAGLRAVEREARHHGLLDEANTALERKDLDTVRSRLAIVLAENPKNEAAQIMLRTIGEKSTRLAPESLLSKAYGKPISIDFRDVSLKQVFEVIAHAAGLNILFDKDVKLDQKTSIFLKDSTIEAAVYYMLLTNQLEQQVMDADTILIYPNNPAKQKDYQQMVIKTFMLANVEAKVVATTLKTILKMRDVVVDDKLNMVIVRDSAEAIRLAEKLVATQDVAEPEVMLEVEVLEVTHTKLMELGVTWPTAVSLTPLASAFGNALTLADLTRLNKGTIGASLDPFKLTARNQVVDTNILANPRIRALNHEKARIMIGNRVPNITTSVTATGIITESINYLDVGLKLEVEPTIYLDNDVAIKVGLEVSSIVDTQRSNSGTVTYTIGSRTANTTLRLKDGENQVLAGLINDQDRNTANRVPGLGSIPLAGRLFGSTLSDGQKTEIVLSITPRLIRNIQRPEAVMAEFLSGTESSYRRRPDLSARRATVVPVSVLVPAVRGDIKTLPAVAVEGQLVLTDDTKKANSNIVTEDTSAATGDAVPVSQLPAPTALGAPNKP